MYRILCYCKYLLFLPQNNELLIVENASRLSNLFTPIYTKKHLNKIALLPEMLGMEQTCRVGNLNIHLNPTFKKIIRFKVLIQSKAIEYFFLQRLCFVQC